VSANPRLDEQGTSPFFPATISLTGSSTSKPFSLLFTGSSQPGAYNLSVALSGSSAAEFDAIFSKGNEFLVVDEFTAPTVPRVLSALFADDGASVAVVFDSATNQGGILGGGTFICSLVLSFEGCATTLCRWSTGSSTLILYPGPNSMVHVGTRVTLLPSIVTAACTASIPDGAGRNCTNYEYVKATVMTLLKPTNAIQPTVSIAAPLTIGQASVSPIHVDFITFHTFY
jgi:hypothetical protein